MESLKAFKEKHLLMGLKVSINKYEWTKELDDFLCESTVRNYFSFDVVSLELNEEAKLLKLDFGATNVFTNEKCRLRWSYLHIKVKNKMMIIIDIEKTRKTY
jgi:hypothetical protein